VTSDGMVAGVRGGTWFITTGSPLRLLLTFDIHRT